jgi:predicted nucleotide-binding protein
MSSHDIEKGERWLSTIFKSLEDINFGVVVLTPDNFNAPWILFEAGALSKNLTKARVVPILCGVSDSDLSKNPLSSFQYIKNEKKV